MPLLSLVFYLPVGPNFMNISQNGAGALAKPRDMIYGVKKRRGIMQVK
jgi:hypothetical protein